MRLNQVGHWESSEIAIKVLSITMTFGD